jgi:actin-related protein
MSKLQRPTAPVILDIGTNITKCGFAGEPIPRAIFKTPVQVFKQRARTTNEWKQILSPLLRTIFLSILQVNIRDRKVIVCESMDLPIAAKNAMMHLFRSSQFYVPAMLFLPSVSLISLCIPSSSILLIDIGEDFTNILPVVDNIPIVGSNQFIAMGMRTVKQDLLTAFKQYYNHHPEQREITEEQLNGMTLDEIGDRLKRNDIPEELQSHVTDILFGENAERINVSECILACLIASDIHIRKQCCGHLVISGGGAYLPGLSSRILNEIHRLIDTSYKQFNGIRDTFAYVATPLFAPNLMAWSGASIMGSIELNDNEWIVRDNLTTF